MRETADSVVAGFNSVGHDSLIPIKGLPICHGTETIAIYRTFNAGKDLTGGRLTADPAPSIPVLSKQGMCHDVDPNEASCRDGCAHNELAIFII